MPSIPSVSIARALIPFILSKFMAMDNINSVFLPPLPSPLTVTVVSPPDKSIMGLFKFIFLYFLSFLICSANSAIFFPSACASPSKVSDKIIGIKPCSSATLAAFLSAIIGVASIYLGVL